MKKGLLTLIVLVTAIIGYVLLTGQNKITDEQREKINAVVGNINTAPDFSLSDVATDSIYTLSELKGNVVLVNFWATWCYPCRLEIPDFNELHKKYHQEGLEILGVSISDNKKSLENFMKSFKIDYPVLYGSQMQIQKISQQYGGINAVPTTFIIGRKGEIVRSFPGAVIKGQPMFYSFIQILENELSKKVVE